MIGGKHDGVEAVAFAWCGRDRLLAEPEKGFADPGVELRFLAGRLGDVPAVHVGVEHVDRDRDLAGELVLAIPIGQCSADAGRRS